MREKEENIIIGDFPMYQLMSYRDCSEGGSIESPFDKNFTTLFTMKILNILLILKKFVINKKRKVRKEIHRHLHF